MGRQYELMQLLAERKHNLHMLVGLASASRVGQSVMQPYLSAAKTRLARIKKALIAVRDRTIRERGFWERRRGYPRFMIDWALHIEVAPHTEFGVSWDLGRKEYYVVEYTLHTNRKPDILATRYVPYGEIMVFMLPFAQRIRSYFIRKQKGATGNRETTDTKKVSVGTSRLLHAHL